MTVLMTPRVSLLGKFCALSLIATVLLALGVGATLHDRIEERALRNAEAMSRLLVELAIAPDMRGVDLTRPVDAKISRRVMQALADADDEAAIIHAHVFGPTGVTVYSDVADRIGDVNTGADFKTALSGRMVSDIERGTGDHGERVEPRLEVYLPLRPGGDGHRINGVAELYLDYTPAAAALHDDTVAVYALLLGGLAGLLLIDLDRFKEVNDTLGHDHGDRLLRDVADRLREALRRGDTLARLGGDEFAVLLHDLPDRAAAAELAGRLLDALERPFMVRDVTVQLGASVGVALCPDHGTDVTSLVRRADVAMYEAKREQGRIRVYDPSRDPNSPERLQRLSELRRGLHGGELVLHYQPKVSVEGGSVTGVEALVRWQHPDLGMLAPGEFLPLAERTRMMNELTRWVVDAALRQAREWQDVGIEVPIAINLAAANILDAGLPDMVGERLAHHGVPGERLTCELSEHTVMADPRRATEVLERVRALGVRISLDDFGTGQSSLAYLKRLPLDEVKIDRGFVSGMVVDEDDALIVRSTIDLARDLGLEVVAEGVEAEEVLDHLRLLRCHEAQG